MASPILPFNSDDACIAAFVDALRARECDPKTIACYQSALTIFRLDVAKDLLDVGANDVFRVVELWQRQNLAPATVRRRASGLRQFYNIMFLEGLISVRPTADLRVPKPWRRAKVQPAIDLERVISAVGIESPLDVRDRALLLLLRDSGIRASAVARCELVNVDWKLGRLMLRKDKYAKDHFVPLSKRSLTALRQYVDTARPYFLHGRELPYIFPALRKDTPLTRQRVWQVADKWSVKVLGVRCSPHSWRRTMITEGAENGMEVFDLMQLAGHDNPRTTQQYINHSTEKLRDIFYRSHPRAKGQDR